MDVVMLSLLLVALVLGGLLRIPSPRHWARSLGVYLLGALPWFLQLGFSQYRDRNQTQGTHVTLPPNRWPIGDTALISYPRREKVRKPDLQLGHQRLQCVQEFASAVMRRWLLVKLPFKGTKELVKLFRFDHGPRDDL
jgi:hypothetical protein